VTERKFEKHDTWRKMEEGEGKRGEGKVPSAPIP
jgi:hypothetical protein